jgi:DNA-binding winged helix-turn-helix (wHTH) protein
MTALSVAASWSGQVLAPPVSFGPFRLRSEMRLLERDGVPVRIGGRALDILIVLAERPGEVVTKRELIEGSGPT